MFEGFFSQAVEYFPILMEGAWTTIGITLCALLISTLLGLFWALLRVSSVRWLAEGRVTLTSDHRVNVAGDPERLFTWSPAA